MVKIFKVHVVVLTVLLTFEIGGLTVLRLFQPNERLSQVALPYAAFVVFGSSILLFPIVSLKLISQFQRWKGARSTKKYIALERIHFYSSAFVTIIIIFSCFFFTLLPIWFDSALVVHDSVPPKPQIIAHRGMSMEKPENTLAAFIAALKFGAWGISSKVWFTKDSVRFVNNIRFRFSFMISI